jgi:hypothetical protein
VEAANKPVITKINASVKPGAKLTIEGTKLHLVEAIYFQTDVKAVLYGVRTETSIEVFVPETALWENKEPNWCFQWDEVFSNRICCGRTDPLQNKHS